MERDFYPRVPLEDVNKWFIRMVIRMLKDEVEVPDGLMIVNGEKEIDLFQA